MDQKKTIFVVFGMPRAGTTYLFHNLGNHPQIFLPIRKESFYFSANYAKGENWFRALYNEMDDSQIGGDINPMYYFDPESIDRILDYDPTTKVILGVRDPISFARSLHKNIQTMGWEVPGLAKMLCGYDWKLTDAPPLRIKLDEGYLESRINEIQNRFRGNLLIYDFSYFQSCPLNVLKEIELFLGTVPFFTEDNCSMQKINASDRRNIPILNWLITQQKFLDLAYRLLPNTLVRAGRRLFDHISVASNPTPDGAAGSNDDSENISGILASDVLFYQKLFEEKPVLR